MEKLTAAQERKLAELLAIKEKMEQHDKEFFKEVRSRKEEVLCALKIDDSDSSSISEEQAAIIATVQDTADKIGCDVATLLKMICHKQQIEYWRKVLVSSIARPTE